MLKSILSGKAATHVLLFSLLLTASFTFAQGGGMGGNASASPEDRAKRLTLMMKDQLALTAAQEPKVADINVKYAKKNEELRKVADTAARRKAMKDMNKQRETEFKGVLTADQFKKYLKLEEEMRARRREMGK